MLSIKNLKVSVEGNEILKGLDLEIKPGEVHAIMGPNGSGKSTLSATLAGREEYEVTEGKSPSRARICWSWIRKIAPAKACSWPSSTRWRSPASATISFCRRRSTRCANTASRSRWIALTSPISSKRKSRCWICRPIC